jgi:NAD(P)-dependent dehydrogenase (short-subunit alcohol dehydrogenase family)
MDIIPNNKLFDLTGKTAIVIEGSLGIGFGISYRLSEAGADGKTKQRCKIINVASIDAIHTSMAGLSYYDVSKHGL